jgi:hypothetical protein
VVKSWIGRRLIGIRDGAAEYAIALRLGASVALTYLPWEPGTVPEPIVRVDNDVRIAGFDPRELVAHDGASAVITLPLTRAELKEWTAFSPN